MKTILTLGLMMLLSLTIVSASYDFTYERPDIREYTHSIFLISKDFGSSNPLIQMVYSIFTQGLFWQDQTLLCEIELEKQINKNDNGGSGNHNHQSTQQIIPEEKTYVHFMGDTNCDGVVSAQDKANAALRIGNTERNSKGCLIGDANNDGVVSAGDMASVQANWGKTA